MIIFAVLQMWSKIWPRDYWEEIQLAVRVVLKPVLGGTGLQFRHLYNHPATLPSAWFEVSP